MGNGDIIMDEMKPLLAKWLLYYDFFWVFFAS